MERTIVGRLRIALLSFMLASVSVVVLVWKQMEQLSVVENVIFDSALPALRLNQDIDRHITSAIYHATTMASDISQEQVNDAYIKMKAEKQQLFDLLFSETAGAYKKNADIINYFTKIDELTEELFSLITQRSITQSENMWILNELQDTQTQFSLSSESEYLDSWVRLNLAIKSPNTDTNLLIDGLANLGIYTELESQILQLFVLVESLSNSVTYEQLRKYEQRIEFIINNASQALLSQQEVASATSLSKTLNNLSSFVNRSSGLASNVRNLIKIESRRNELSNKILKNVSEISRLQRGLMSSTENTISDVGALLRRTISRTILICLLGFTVIILTVLFISQFLLKSQIADRMSKLSDIVERLASGEVDIDIDVRGEDEISKIEKSLIIFRKNSKELLRSNTDLEKFAYVASHDLRTPIQAIHNLACWTIEDFSYDIPDSARENLELIISRTLRMRQLTSDLLKYARLNEADRNISAFDCRELLEDVIGLACGGDSQFTFQMEISSEIVVGPVTPIRQIVSNLIGNAVKHHDQEMGHIVISVKVVNDVLTVTVQDDGPGIPPNYHKQVFEPFFRLKSQDEVPGSGMGLASVTRLVQTFEGSIELHSDPDIRRGTTFTVSILLPDQHLSAGDPELKRSA